MAWVFRLGEDPPAGAEIGGKARGLSLLFAASVPCPPGIVVPAKTLAAIRSGDRDATVALDEACSALAFPVVVRSSASIEDSAVGAAPGLFESVGGVASASAARSALADVATSAESDAVMAYCGMRGIDVSAVAISAIVQQEIQPSFAGTLYTRPPSRPMGDSMVCEVHRGPSAPAVMSFPRRGKGADEHPSWWPQLREHALSSERAIDAVGGADVEWVVDSSGVVWIVQARPIVHPPAGATPAPSLFEFSRGDPRPWRLDVTHNPDPLSPAQASLVRRVANTGVGPEMRVVGGYLYYASQPNEAPASNSDRDLAAQFAEEILPAVLAVLSPHEGKTVQPLADVLAAYTAVIRIYSEIIHPTLSRSREALREFLKPIVGEETDDIMTDLLTTRSDQHLAARIRRVARGEETVESLLDYAAPMSAAWDVAAPTFAEDPTPVLHAVDLQRQRRDRALDTAERVAHALQLRKRMSRATANDFDRHLEIARQAQQLGEVDDHIFFRAQAMVRRALLDIASTWQLADPADVFFVDLEWLEGHAAGSSTPSEFDERVQSARATRAAQRDTVMPLEILDGAGVHEEQRGHGGDSWRGIGIGGRALGPVVKIEDMGRFAGATDGCVVVARSLSPSLIFAVAGAAAVVSVYGGPLGHGAAMARELGIPCIVRCAGAWRALRDGDEVWVDGDSGWLVRPRRP